MQLHRNSLGTSQEDKSGQSVCNDTRLGPKRLPLKFPLLSIASNYDRFGNLTPGDFLEKHWDPNVTYNGSVVGGWKYPKHGGFQLDVDGIPIRRTITLPEGMIVDRFGKEQGHYIAAADAPFAQRSLPPDALNRCLGDFMDCFGDNIFYPNGYHIYKVMKPFEVVAGPIAPAFGQFGLVFTFQIRTMSLS